MQSQYSYNASRVLQTVWQHDSISRTEISKELGLNKSTITKLLTPMIEDNIIIPIEKQASGQQGGRKAEVLSINEKYGVVIGIEIQTAYSALCVTDLKGSIIVTDKFENCDIYESFQELIEYVLDQSMALCKRRGFNLIGATLGVSGVINPYEGIVYRSNPLKVETPVKIYDKLSDYPFPILIENDANCCCYNQQIPSINNRTRNFLCILGEFRKTTRGSLNESGIAIGIGIMIKESILHGENFSAGEFQSLYKSADNPSQFDLKASEIDNIQDNEEVLKRVLRELSRNISLLVNTLNISLVYFEGNIVDTKFMLKPILRDEIQRNWNYDSQVDCQIVFSNKRDFAVAHGAACCFLEKLFSPSKFWEDRNEYYPSGIDFFNQIHNRVKS